MQDDELRELFKGGRAEDRAHAPSFDETWSNAQREASRSRIGVWAIAAAAVIVLAGGWLAFGASEPKPSPIAVPGPDRVATNPVPDIPEDTELDGAELASWEPAVFDSPSDFLLEDDGLVGLGLAPTIDDSVLDIEDLEMEL